MSKRLRRTFTPEFKAEAVSLLQRSGQSIAQVAKELGLSPSSLRQWALEAERKTPASAGPAELNAEIDRLKSRLRHVEAERDFLKKAAAFFARESK